MQSRVCLCEGTPLAQGNQEGNLAATRSRAPEFPAGLEWFNVGSPVKLAGLRGRVVLLNFGTFGSVHCQQVLADLNYLAMKYRDALVIINVNSPRFPAEMRRSHVQQSILRHHVSYPVLHDPELKLWKTYGIKVWPTQVLIDHDGFILGGMSGAGKLPRLEQVISHQSTKCSVSASGQLPAVSAGNRREPAGVLSFPGKVLATGNRLYIADSGHHRVLAVSSNGQVLQQYGCGNPGFIDGTGTTAAFNSPRGMALAGEFLYVADQGNHAIRRIHIHTDDVVTIAGTGKAAGTGITAGLKPVEVELNAPGDLVFLDGKLFIAMTGLHQIWRLSLVANTIDVFSGSGQEGLADGPPGLAMFAQPAGLTLLGSLLYSIDSGASAVREIDLESGAVSTLVGEGLFVCGNRDGIGSAARLQAPLGIAADPGHQMLWLVDTYNNKLRRIGMKTRNVAEVMLDRALDEPGGLAFHDDTLYIANTNAHEILTLNPNNGHAESLNVTEEFIEI
jgi:thiol-disulfide isomerase/thioredoxin